MAYKNFTLPINLSYDNLGLSLNLRGITPLVDTSPFQLPSLLSIKKDIRSVGTTDYARDIVRAKLKSLELQKVQLLNGQQLNGNSTVKLAAASGISALSSTLTNNLSNNIFGDDTELGRGMGTLFSLGVSSATDTLSTNLLKGTTLTEGLGLNVGESLAGAGVGIAGNLIGKGINSIGGDSMLSRGIGQGVATGIGSFGGTVVSNLLKGNSALLGFKGMSQSTKAAIDAAKAAGDMSKASDLASAAKFANTANIVGLAGSVVGSGLQAAFGPSHEYGGRYGSITQGMDTAYDLIQTGISFVPGWGTLASGAMALNKGLSNIFGSTDGMTKQDAILGSAFMPAPVKWLNMWGSSKTGTFNNLSWLNTEKVNSFMGNAFGNLGERFDLAREEAGKVYGTFSQGAKRRALANIDFANNAWGKVLGMADLNEILKIRSQYMSSINNQRYAQEIGGVWQPLARGKYGMKILNNATNHNIGQRLLSGAALIDNKQMILSAQGGTKVARPPRMRAHRKGDESKGLTPEEQEWWKQHEEEQKRLLEEENAKKRKLQEETADKFNKQTSTVMGALTQQANETPFTGLEYQQATEDLRQKKVEKFHEAEKIGEAAMMADLAVSAAPLLLRGFRWAFNKAGLLVKVPVQKTIQLKSGITKSVLDNGKIRLSLPSHTDNKPRQFVLEPARDAGDNKYYVHMRMWDDIENKIPASNVTNEEKQQLFDALYDELPEGAEILFPKSGPGFYGTRGTVAGLQRLAKDPRFTPGTKGTLLYLDKDGKTVRTYEGTSFIKAPEDIRYSLESDYKGKPVILSVPKTMRKADSDVAKMNEYHTANVLEYNQSTGNNVTSIPFRTDYNGRLVKVLPNEEFNTVVRSKNTNAPSGNEYNIGGMYSKNDDTVYLRNTGNPSNNYHEFLHSSHYGETNPEVTQWRILQLIDEDKVSKMTPQQKAYYISVKETPVHLRLQGERMNIEVGDPYPGDEAFDKMLNEYGIGGATYYMKRDTSKAKQLLWKAFNGTLFSGLTAATLYNTNK